MDKVLVIDDDRATGILIKDILEDSIATGISGELAELFGNPDKNNGHGGGFHVILAVTGWDGINVMKRSVQSGENISVAFVDLTLTDMSGLDVGCRLRKIDGRTKIVFLSGTDFSEAAAGIDSLPADGSGLFIQKPFTADEILHHALTLSTERNIEMEKQMMEMRSFLNLNIYNQN